MPILSGKPSTTVCYCRHCEAWTIHFVNFFDRLRVMVCYNRNDHNLDVTHIAGVPDDIEVYTVGNQLPMWAESSD